MPNREMTIEEVQKLRSVLEDSIDRLVDDFYNQTGTYPSAIQYSSPMRSFRGIRESQKMVCGGCSVVIMVEL